MPSLIETGAWAGLGFFCIAAAVADGWAGGAALWGGFSLLAGLWIEYITREPHG